MQTDTSVIKLETNLIVPNRYQPRKMFDEKALDDLAMSIKTYGIINPILVRKKDDKYEIIAGERRFRAAQKVGLTEVPVIIKDANEQQMAEIALMENIQRQGLTAIEEAKSYEEILKIGNQTQASLAEKLGKSQSSIANKIRLLALPKEVQDALAQKKISERHARSLLTVTDEERQLELLDRIITERLTVKETEQIINEKDISEEEIKQAISDIMKSLNIKEEEKEDDNMNNGNFFPNYDNNGTNNPASLNMMNMQSMNPQPENVMAPTETQFTLTEAPVEQTQFIPNMQMPTIEPQMAPTMPEFTPAEPQIVAPVLNDAPLFGPVSMEQAPTVSQTPMVDVPLFNPTVVMPTIEPQITPAMPEFTPTEPQMIAPVAPMIDVPSFEVPVLEPTNLNLPTDDKLTKLKDLLTVNGYNYKIYSNETENCVIIEVPKN